MSICPQCGGDQFCPCDACFNSSSKGMVKWQYVKEGQNELQKCGHCGFIASLDWWMDWDGTQYEMHHGPSRMMKFLYWSDLKQESA